MISGGLLQISDTHFGTERPQVMAALLRLTHSLRPELLAWTGDITQRARVQEFTAARDFLRQLAVPNCLVMPGNHDLPLLNLPLRLLRPYARFCSAFGPDLAPRLSMTGWLLLGVKTTRRWRHKNGQVSAAQIAQVAQALRQAQADQLRVVLVHQPMAVTQASDRVNLLRGHAAAAQAWAEAGADLVLGGHIHLPYVLPLHETRPHLARPLWCVQAGTAVSARVRGSAGNSVNFIGPLHRQEGRRRCTVQRWDYDETAAIFRPGGSQDLMLGP